MSAAPSPPPLHGDQVSPAARPQLIVFGRLPVRGQVKTRLASSIGADEALAVHVSLLESTLELAASLVPVRRCFCFAGDADAAGALTRDWLDRLRDTGWTLREQTGEDLGARMRQALQASLDEGAQRVVLIGTDCPVFGVQDLSEAFTALRTSDVVVSPAEDGGYALVGVSRPAWQLFQGIDWGGPFVLEQTLARAAASGHGVALLRTVWDVDTVEDLARYRRLQHQADRFRPSG